MSNTANDLEAIRGLLGRYADHIDAVDLDGLATLFTEDATAWLLGTELTGRDEIIDYVGKALDRCEATSHLIGSHVVDAAWDSATQTAVVQAFHRFRDTGETWLLHGRYVQSLVLTGDGWRITRHELHGIGSEPDGGGPSRSYSGHPRRRTPQTT
ncbi:hypothetical protein DVS28_a4253 [Euzebya pacifica]|uniref:SnoaL-like domain-containing protein n=1 Tax=Euzebya pacifica TaxID=1608957 RepID=A0A346Y372_9ACTN|nr:nuclear transport factor 2 family protein [Euzebya pacifica]AXV08919.1 hypothetical protein DVS28_a4253 [Euzebya pacifica]